MDIYFENKINLLERAKYNNQYPDDDKNHFHNEHELYYLAQGHVKYFIDNKIYDLQSGDMVFIPKGIFHRTSYESVKSAERLLISFDDEYIGEDYLEYIYELWKNHHIRIQYKYIDEFNDLLRKIEYEHNNKENGYQKMEKLYLRQLLIFISRHRLNEIPDKTSEIHKLIQDAANYVSQNSSADLSLTTIAKKYNVSTGYFSKSFKNVTGMRFSEYINITRITAASKLLETTNMSITDISAECGFDDSNYFAAVFKKYKGVTPKKYAVQFKK